MPPKRKLVAVFSAALTPVAEKIAKTSITAAAATENSAGLSATTQAHGHDNASIVDRKFYPDLLSDAKCVAYASGSIPRPIDELTSALSSAGAAPPSPPSSSLGYTTVIHWFRTDLRVDDNAALHLASDLAVASAKERDCCVMGLYVFSPQDFDAHVVSPARVDLILRSLEELRRELGERNIPLWIEGVEKRKDVAGRVVRFAETWGAGVVVVANGEYEVDELRRDARAVMLGRENGVEVRVVEDTCIVAPGKLVTKSTGKAFQVYSPWYRAWLAYLKEHPESLTMYPPPVENPAFAKERFGELFNCPIPLAPENKRLSTEEAETLHLIFPAGSEKAHSRLSCFLTERAKAYAINRNFPSRPGTSVLSPYFAAGVLSTRTAVCLARKANNDSLVLGHQGLATWISEIAWRDFYKHVLVAFPYVCMNKPFKPEYSSITWCPPALGSERFNLWTQGRTGYPLVDAAMRQLKQQKWMPNRVRMVVASFLCKDLHVDWRLGERYFLSQLVDGDWASNNGGWGFSSSTGVDPQPYHRIFNPTLQSRRFDAEGRYIRTWVEELREVGGEEVHDPSEDTRKRVGYAKKCVEHDVQRKEALVMYKEVAERAKTQG